MSRSWHPHSHEVTGFQATHLRGTRHDGISWVAAAADEGLAAAVGGEAAGAQAAIVIVSGDPGAREILHRELSKRYGTDYQIVVCDRARGAGSRGCGTCGPLACRWRWSLPGSARRTADGIEVLATVRAIDPRALRVAVLGWGDWDSVRSVFDAVTLGTVDHWVNRPVQAPAEEFHRSITEFLREWATQRGGGFEPVRVIGERWSARSQELRDLFARHQIPAGFYDAASRQGQQILRELGLDSPELPVVVLAFAAERRTLVNPSNLEIADAFGLMTTGLARGGLRCGGGRRGPGRAGGRGRRVLRRPFDRDG